MVGWIDAWEVRTHGILVHLHKRGVIIGISIDGWKEVWFGSTRVTDGFWMWMGWPRIDLSLSPTDCRRHEVVVVSLGKYARSYLVPVSFLPRTPTQREFREEESFVDLV